MLHSAPAAPVLRVAIDGVDGAGKTTFADELAEVLRGARPVIRASIDSFHNPRAVRYARGRGSPEGYFHDSFNYDGLLETLLNPLTRGGSGCYRTALFDHRRDAQVEAPEEIASAGSILVFDGIFLHRPELSPYWDVSVFLRVDTDISVRRCADRDGSSPDPQAPENRRYVEGQRLYLAACDPARRATFLVDNNDFERPRLIAARPA